MTQPDAPQVDCDQHHAGLTVEDIPTAVDFYTTKLGFKLGFTWGDPPNFAAVNLDRVQIFLLRGKPGAQKGSVYFVVGNADDLFEFHRANGVEIAEPLADRPYGLRDYAVRDLHGHELSFGHHVFNMGPPIEIERVDVPVRLEKRLAALLADLAAHKGMSLTSCLEEILLHTNEPFGDGVASPHTAAQLRYIQELKKKHAIDYDSHASYRFVERQSPKEG
jgi:catechol 2,3-dioxygenase-like lactoylglutathione lyase family enzyme